VCDFRFAIVNLQLPSEVPLNWSAVDRSQAKSVRGQPHSKTLRDGDAVGLARQRFGVRLSSAAFPSPPSS
jgi:hypothetical protein